MGRIENCKFCGAEIQGEANFCKACGHSVLRQAVVSGLVSDTEDGTEILFENTKRPTGILYPQDPVSHAGTLLKSNEKRMIHNGPGLKYMDHVLTDSQIEELVRLKSRGIYSKRRTLRTTMLCIIIFLIIILGFELFVLKSGNAIGNPITAPPISMVYWW